MGRWIDFLFSREWGKLLFPSELSYPAKRHSANLFTVQCFRYQFCVNWYHYFRSFVWAHANSPHWNLLLCRLIGCCFCDLGRTCIDYMACMVSFILLRNMYRGILRCMLTYLSFLLLLEAVHYRYLQYMWYYARFHFTCISLHELCNWGRRVARSIVYGGKEQVLRLSLCQVWIIDLLQS